MGNSPTDDFKALFEIKLNQTEPQQPNCTYSWLRIIQLLLPATMFA